MEKDKNGMLLKYQRLASDAYANEGKLSDWHNSEGSSTPDRACLALPRPNHTCDTSKGPSAACCIHDVELVQTIHNSDSQPPTAAVARMSVSPKWHDQVRRGNASFQKLGLS